MDFIEPILSIATQIYEVAENVKANKKRCHRVSERVRALETLVKSIKERKVPESSKEVASALRDLSFTLKSAQELMDKYASAKWVERILKSSSHGDEFDIVNERLNDAFQVLSVALQVQQGDVLYKAFELGSREEDKREDEEELKKLLLEYMKAQEEKLESLKNNVEKIVQMLDKPTITEDIRLIRPSELTYKLPKEPFMTTPTSAFYKGEYRGFTVAIKRYLVTTSATTVQEVKPVFDEEVQTMKKFESPNILRMFGICVEDEEGPSPQFLIIMEYCEKGSLRNVLNSDTLSWTIRAHMCLDAAQGLYRLHQTEDKSKVHRCIDSNKFLVAEGYRVKLGGFELAKTETSLKKLSTEKLSRANKSTSLNYSCPGILQSIKHAYTKECEMYSFGILMWEISTSKTPFEDCSREQIYEKVWKEKFQEPLPDDCPASLRELIDACRAFDSFQRPSAGVLVDKLRSVVAQLEEQ